MSSLPSPLTPPSISPGDIVGKDPVANQLSPPESTLAGSDDLLDRSMLEQICAIKGARSDLLQHVITLYLDNSPTLLQEMTVGVERGDRTLLQRAAHTLGSSSANMGAQRLSRLCRELELGAGSEAFAVRDSVSNLCAEYERVAHALKAELEIVAANAPKFAQAKAGMRTSAK